MGKPPKRVGPRVHKAAETWLSQVSQPLFSYPRSGNGGPVEALKVEPKQVVKSRPHQRVSIGLRRGNNISLIENAGDLDLPTEPLPHVRKFKETGQTHS